MLRDKSVAFARRYVPRRIRGLVRSFLGSADAPAVAVARLGVVEDLCYWVADDRADTAVPLHNYFSVLFPDVDTRTTARIELYDREGRRLAEHALDLPAHGLITVRVSRILGAERRASGGYGALLCDIRIPDAVRALLADDVGFHFWDRFYVSYVSRAGQPCFVHGVDKTYVVDAADGGVRTFYPAGRGYSWQPEIPVDMGQYERFSVILINRTTGPATVTLTVTDSADQSMSWRETMPPFGTHRFDLDAEATAGLVQTELRLRVDGMPTRWGRPVVMKHFRNGAISAMHC